MQRNAQWMTRAMPRVQNRKSFKDMVSARERDGSPVAEIDIGVSPWD